MTWAGGELLSYTGGNPNDWTQNRSFAWTGGRNLQSVYQNGTLLALYNYDSAGLRVFKLTGTGSTQYYILDSQYQGQVSTINGQSYTLSYYWDEAGAPMGVKINGSAYFFVKNLQGDVVAITDYQGNVAARYTYDVWGKLLSVVNGAGNPVTDPTHVANLNPFRYRGYFYDPETGFYYLSSRYYDPEVGRFINADSYVSTGQGFSGNNMFIYCGDNPVNRVDYTGEMAQLFFVPSWMKEIVVKVVAGFIGIFNLDNSTNGSEVDTKSPPDHPDYVPSKKNGNRKVKNPNGEGRGWEDKDGNVWIPSPKMHGGAGWTVQHPGGGHSHAYPGGKVRDHFQAGQSWGESAIMVFTGVVLTIGLIVDDVTGIGVANNYYMGGSLSYLIIGLEGFSGKQVCGVCGEVKYGN